MVKKMESVWGDKYQVSATTGGNVRVYIDEVDHGQIFMFDLTKEDSAALRRALFNAEWDLA